VLNEVTIRRRIGIGHGASGSIAAGPQPHTVAGVGVDAAPREAVRERDAPGLPGLRRVVVDAVG
jgi:hypothetical protein